jgi:hypothetical protein
MSSSSSSRSLLTQTAREIMGCANEAEQQAQLQKHIDSNTFQTNGEYSSISSNAKDSSESSRSPNSSSPGSSSPRSTTDADYQTNSSGNDSGQDQDPTRNAADDGGEGSSDAGGIDQQSLRYRSTDTPVQNDEKASSGDEVSSTGSSGSRNRHGKDAVRVTDEETNGSSGDDRSIVGDDKISNKRTRPTSESSEPQNPKLSSEISEVNSNRNIEATVEEEEDEDDDELEEEGEKDECDAKVKEGDARKAKVSRLGDRSGKWTTEEEEYARYLIECFDKGILREPEKGTSLRSYLAKALKYVCPYYAFKIDPLTLSQSLSISPPSFFFPLVAIQ